MNYEVSTRYLPRNTTLVPYTTLFRSVLRDELPATKTVIVTSHGRAGHLKRALSAGVRGFLPKTVSSGVLADVVRTVHGGGRDRKSTRLNSSHVAISYAVFCLKTKTTQ